MEAIRTTLAALLGATATVMAISVGVVSVIPALLELVRTYNADYFISEDMRDRLRSDLRLIAHTIWLLGLVQLICVLGLLVPRCAILIAACVPWVVAMALLLWSGFHVSQLAIASMRPFEAENGSR